MVDGRSIVEKETDQPVGITPEQQYNEKRMRSTAATEAELISSKAAFVQQCDAYAMRMDDLNDIVNAVNHLLLASQMLRRVAARPVTK